MKSGADLSGELSHWHLWALVGTMAVICLVPLVLACAALGWIVERVFGK